METSVENSDGTEIPRKSRSLDIQSIYKSRVSNEALNEILKRKRRLDGDCVDGEAVKKKRKSRKEVSLSSIERKGRSLDEVYSGSSGGAGVSSGSNDSNNSLRLVGNISLSLDDNVIKIPRRRRGFLRRKKFEGNQVLKRAVPSSSKVGIGDDDSKLSGDLGIQGISAKVKQKKCFDELKKIRSSGLNSSRRFRKGDSFSVVKNGSSSLRRRNKDQRKKKNLRLESQSSAKEVKPAVDNCIKVCDDLQEDDEENLEQNAARMLSSRFDPNCTGFSSNRKVHASPSDNGLSFLISSGRNFVGREVNSAGDSKSASLDAAGRILRPRKQHKQKGLSRKRRHFYEILSRDLDAHWVLHRRIKVFWPLDQSWYFGLVNDYDPERNLHHVKYDDRDEEWINLQNERFKLLLLPSEVPGKADPKKLAVGDKCVDKEKGDLNIEDDSYLGSYMDSEPIISWLARSTRRVKSSPFGILKKQKSSNLSSNSVRSLLSEKTVDEHGCLGAGFSERDTSKCSNSALSGRLTNAGRGENSEFESTPCSKDEKLPLVYYRRRYHKKNLQLHHIIPGDPVCRSAPESVTVASKSHDIKKFDFYSEQQGSEKTLWSADDAGLLKLTIPLMKFGQFKFEIIFPVIPVFNYALDVVNFCLFHTLLLLQYGTVMTMWPMVHLEMLFVDNVVGLRFILFEGCLKQAVAFVFLVLTVFHQLNEQGNHVDLKLPVTSISFKFSSIQDLKKQFVFAFYNFSRVKHSKWLYLDNKLKRHCSLTKQLPLSDCTYDNIKALRSGSDQLAVSSDRGELPSFEGLQRRSRQSIFNKGVVKESAYLNMSQSCIDEKLRRLPPFALSFAAAPTFFLNLHLKLLLERSVACVSLRDHDSVALQEHVKNSSRLIMNRDDCSLVENFSSECSESALKNDLKAVPNDVACSELLSCGEPVLETDVFHENGGMRSSDLSVAGASHSSQDTAKNEIDAPARLQKQQCGHSTLGQCVLSSRPSVPIDHSSQDKALTSCYSSLNGSTVEIGPFNEVERFVDRGMHCTQVTQQSSDLSWNMNDGVIRSLNPTAPRSMWHRSRNNYNSSSFGYISHVWPDQKADLLRNGFGNGPRKPRTQVSYTLPFGGHDVSSKHRSLPQKGVSHKRIRRASEKRTSDGSRSSQRDLELLSCDANVLITVGDKGWRECGAQVTLELVDHNEWRLAVKLSGITKYSYKAHQFLQPGTTNRYTHDMMWKGGKDWILEFPDRTHWVLFKEMHEECYNRNVRAALVKNIPIPGVHLIEEGDDTAAEVTFVRNSCKYFRQLETDVDMAMDPSRILYDMDSDDEQWILKNQNSSDTNQSGVGENFEMFEKIMDMLEKVAYAQQRDEFTSDEIGELMVGVGSVELIKSIYEHWWQKRQMKGMPLIRQLQPPLWERYQQQVKEWELAMAKACTTLSNGCQEKAVPLEKPPMFAFCLKPRGLEVPNKGSKQRSQRKLPVSGQSNAISADQDGFHTFGRRSNGFSFGDEKVIFPGHVNECSDASPLLQASTRVFSPRDAGCTGYFSMSSSDGFERNRYPKLHRNKSRKIGTFLSSHDPQVGASYNQITVGKSSGMHRLSMGLLEWPSQKHLYSEGSHRPVIEPLDDSDLHEFRLRDASSAAQHALNMAKLKREKAQRLLYRADLAIHKAVVALMTAEAIKASSENSSGDG